MENIVNIPSGNCEDEVFYINLVEESEQETDMLCHTLGCA
jgi:hypothetical protein